MEYDDEVVIVGRPIVIVTLALAVVGEAQGSLLVTCAVIISAVVKVEDINVPDVAPGTATPLMRHWYNG